MNTPYLGVQKVTQKSSVLSKSSWRKFAHFSPIERFAYGLRLEQPLDTIFRNPLPSGTELQSSSHA